MRGCEERSSQKTAVQTWGRVLGPAQGIYITISLSCFPNTKIPTRRKKFNSMMPTSTWTPDWLVQKVDGAVSRLLPTSQKNVHKLIMPSSLIKLSYYPSSGWDRQFEGINLLWPPLPGKAIHLFLFHFTQSCL